MKKIISIILVAVMLVSMTQLTTMADILPAVETDADVQQTASVQTLNASMLGDTNTSGNFEVSSLSVAATTGTVPFDGNDNAGNDSSGTNNIVRTFDTIVYNFTVTTTASQTAEARVKLEFVLPLTNKQAKFDTSAMLWMDTTSGYMWEITTDDTTGYQTLTCYKHLSSSDKPDDASGAFNFTENVNVKVLNMANNEKIRPTFKATMVGGTATQTFSPNEITVSAAPKYNIQIGGKPTYKSTFDFNSGNEKAKEYGEGYAKGEVVGRTMVVGITIQLYNDNPAKGFKGIEMPTGDITFDISLQSKYLNNDVTSEYMPLLWSCDGNLYTGYGGSNSDGRVLYDSYGCAQAYAPYNKGDQENYCYDGGSWIAKQEGSIVHVRVSGYKIDLDKMPTKNGDLMGSYGEEFGIGCFSAGEMWIVQPFNKIGTTSYNPGTDFDIVKAYGQGTFSMNITAMNMKAQTVSGATFQDSNGTSDAQTKNDDDSVSQTLELTRPGSLQNRVNYANDPNWQSNGVGVDSKYDGSDFGTPGTTLYILGGFSYDTTNEQDNQLYWGTNLTKFYGSALEVTGDASPYYQSGAKAEEMICYYATKKYGTDWNSDYELQNTYEDDLVFYKSRSDIPSGHLCVGILFCFKGPGSVLAPNSYYWGRVPAKIRDDISLAGNTYMLASTSRVWTKSMFESAGMTLDTIPDWSNTNTKLSSFPTNFYKSGNIDGSTWYTKETYAADGSGALGTHNSDWCHWGDTLLVIGYKTGINKSLAQTIDGKAKDIYNLDSNQRVVDFKLQPSISDDNNSGQSSQTATVTIVDTLPKYLTYIPNSCYFGGTYQQTSVNGGTQGTITGDTTQREPDSITTNSDGTQTLTWVITDVMVGQEMPAIYYAAMIGNQGDSTLDVPSTATTKLKTSVRITAEGYDLRTPTTQNGNYDVVGLSAVKGSVSSYGKYALESQVDADGNIDYTIYFNAQNGNVDNAVLLDTMPQNGLPDTSANDFTGTYTVTEWKLDIEKYTSPSSLTLYYTTDSSYAGRTMQGDNAIPVGEITKWQNATISNTTGTATFDNTPVAWAVIGNIPQGESINISLTIKLIPDFGTAFKQTSKYTNILSNEDSQISAITTAVQHTFSLKKSVCDANNKPVDDDAVYNFKLSKAGGGDLSDNERSYLNSDGSTTSKINKDGTFTLKKDESIKFVGLTNGEQYKIQETDVPSYVLKTECSDSGFDSDTKTLTFTSNNNTEMSTEFKNILKSLDVTFKYYGRETVNGKPADIKNDPITYTKTFLANDNNSKKYFDGTYQDSIYIMMVDASTNLKCDNVLDAYSLWITQWNASGSGADGNTGIKYFATTADSADNPYYEIVRKNYAAPNNYKFRANRYGKPVQDEKWVTYYNSSGTEVDYENVPYENKKSVEVSRVTVWLFNTPKQYTVDAYQAQTFSDLKKISDGKYIADEAKVDNRKMIKAYYNQRLGEAIDDGADYSQATAHLAAYGLKSYVGEKLETAASIANGDSTLKFAYWAFDSEGKNIASTDILYNYRITKDRKLYAVYTSDGTVNSGTPGLTATMNNPDIYFNSDGESITRLNTVMNPYNCPNNDTNIKNIAISYIIPEDNTKIVENESERTDNNVNYVLLSDLRDAIKGMLTQVGDNEGSYSIYFNGDYTLTGIKKGNHFVFFVDGHDLTDEDLAGGKDISLTNKNRVEFVTNFKTSALANREMFAFVSMYYDKTDDNQNNGEWLVSDNYVDYKFDANGKFVEEV